MKIKRNGFELTVEIDNDPTDPREHDDCIKIAAWHSRYNLGDAGFGHGKNRHASPQSFLAAMTGDFNIATDDIEALLADFSKTHFFLPVYLMDHSDLSMRCAPFGCPWDSGQVGFVYISKADAAKELENDTQEKAHEQMRLAVETYSDYLSGNVYCWSLRGPDGAYVDSCHGYIGDEGEAERDGRAALAEAVADFLKEESAQATAVMFMIDAAMFA